jgi:hypothetical protein
MNSIRHLFSPILVLLSLVQACPPWKEAPKFEITNYHFQSSEIWSTPSHRAVTQAIVNFTLTNTDVPSSVYCQASSNEDFTWFSGNQIYSCQSGQIGSTNFTFNYAGGGYLKVNETWNCPIRPTLKK